jgi:Zn-dependent protease with chaperone function
MRVATFGVMEHMRRGAMEAGTLYLRLFLGAKSFRSSDMDSLADKMQVSCLMSRNANERYFLTKTDMAALSLGNKVLFGARYYQTLTDKQRLAVTAHEFGHLLAKDGSHRRKRVVAPALVVSVMLASLSFVLTGSPLLLECILAIAFLGSLMIFSAAYSDYYRRQEMRSDHLAASYVDGEALVEAIQAADSLVATRMKKKKIRAIAGRHPATELRVEAIRSKNQV